MRTLMYWVDWYFETRETTPEYRRSVRYRVRQLEEFAGRLLTLEALNDSLINQWVMHLQATTSLAPKTIRDYREAVLQVWRAAAEEGAVDSEPRRIRKIRIPQQTPVAWHLPEIHELLKACEGMPGLVAHTTIPRGLWYNGHFHLLWDTGLRRSDGLTPRWRDLRPGNIFYMRQSKTGEPIPKRLRDETMAILQEIRQFGNLTDDDPLTPWPGSWRQYEHWLRWVVARAKIRKGRTKWIRRSAASYCERDKPGSARVLLGHKTPGLDKAFYLDPSIVGGEIPMPPPLKAS